MDYESLFLETTTNRSSKMAVYTQPRAKIALKAGLRQLVVNKSPCKQNQSTSHFDHVNSSAAAAAQKNNSVVLQQLQFFENQVYQNQQPERSNQYQQR